MTEVALGCGAASDRGLVREQNEDRYWVDAERGAFLVVDGIGGQAGGERAAETAVAAISATVRDAGEGTAPAELVGVAIAAANNCIYTQAREHPELAGMACVLTLALVEGEQVTIGHVGDSRLYVIADGAIRKVTSDHSPVGQVEDAGELTEAEAMAHPRRNEVFRDVGSRPRAADEGEFVEICRCELPGDGAMLLCSDGLSDHLTSRRIQEIAERYDGDATQTARRLVEAANEAGGRDNITVVFVAGPAYRGRTGVTRPRLGVTRILTRQARWGGRIAFLVYGILLGMLLWVVQRIRG
ncbi:MAG TPA: protein phosphatase 2C domain-containing protein [Candidatus Solibacter sp.]|jgi:serine/threonine protein phosphatase PrpC